jgi:hypothetical protein
VTPAVSAGREYGPSGRPLGRRFGLHGRLDVYEIG